MSVPKSMRGDGKLEVFHKIGNLVSYTMKIVSNEKNFPRRYRWCVTSKIVDTTLEIKMNADRANSIRVEDDSDWETRKAFQKKALSDTYALLGLIDVAYSTFGIDAEKIAFWTESVNAVQQYIRKWYEADRDRYGHADKKENG